MSEPFQDRPPRARSFLGLEPTHNPFRWILPIVTGIAHNGGSIFGGAGLAAGVEAMEATSGRPVVWATAQYLNHAPLGSVMDLDVTLAVVGHQITQARVVGRVADLEVLTVNGAFGHRAVPGEGTWALRPTAPQPLDCPVRILRRATDQSINQRLEMRIADGRQPHELDNVPSADGRSAMWARMPGVTAVSAAGLAILGDWVPFGLGQALGARASGFSLDNTLRIVQLVPTEWVLLDIRIQGIRDGFGHGLVHLWSEDGTLLGTASQTAVLRYWDA